LFAPESRRADEQRFHASAITCDEKLSVFVEFRKTMRRGLEPVPVKLSHDAVVDEDQIGALGDRAEVGSRPSPNA